VSVTPGLMVRMNRCGGHLLRHRNSTLAEDINAGATQAHCSKDRSAELKPSRAQLESPTREGSASESPAQSKMKI
jgi:hypothetical protein